MIFKSVLTAGRGWALLLALALLAVQAGALSHGLGHHGHEGHEHEEQVCELCLAFQGIQAGIPPELGRLVNPAGCGALIRSEPLAGPQPSHHFNPSRAPPVDLIHRQLIFNT